MAVIVLHAPRFLESLLSSSNAFSLQQLVLYASILVVLCWFCRFVHKDYHAFLALGPGGTPSTVLGYLTVSWLRIFALKDPLIPPPLKLETKPAWGYLHPLPPRSGPRPTVAGIAPQRQRDQIPPRNLHGSMTWALQDLADANPFLVGKGKSCFEKHGLALFLSNDGKTNNPTMSEHLDSAHVNETCGKTGEFCHLHPTDGSMHLTLHPIDAAMVISHGWGQRHPLAGRNVYIPWRGIFGKPILPAGFVLVYAPNDEAQISELMKIVRAGAWWVGGIGLGEGRR